MASDKSLAAEIEADDDRAPRGPAALAGEPQGLAEALAAYDAAVREGSTARAIYAEILIREGHMPDIGEIVNRVGAERACMRCAIAEKAAHSKLIEAVRAALQPEGERNV